MGTLRTVWLCALCTVLVLAGCDAGDGVPRPAGNGSAAPCQPGDEFYVVQLDVEIPGVSGETGNSIAIGRPGEPLTRLTQNPSDSGPSISPDGTRIAFTSGRNYDFDPEMGSGGLDVFTMDTSGGDLQKITEGSAADWSPDGNEILFLRDGDLRAIDLETRKERVILRTESNPNAPDIVVEASWLAPERIVYLRTTGLEDEVYSVWETDPAGDSHEKLFETTDDVGNVHWSPDGDRFVYSSISVNEGSAITLVEPGGKPERLVTDATSPMWRPDGKSIQFLKIGPQERWFQPYEVDIASRKERPLEDPGGQYDLADGFQGDWFRCE